MARQPVSEIVKLSAIRKQKARRAKQARAAANRIAFGRSKAERELTQARAEKSRRALDACRIETGEDQ
jgi:hypothetical protein